MKTKSYRELLTLKKELEMEIVQIEAQYLPHIKRYWDLKDRLSKLTPYLNKAMIKEEGISMRRRS